MDSEYDILGNNRLNNNMTFTLGQDFNWPVNDEFPVIMGVKFKSSTLTNVTWVEFLSA